MKKKVITALLVICLMATGCGGFDTDLLTENGEILYEATMINAGDGKVTITGDGAIEENGIITITEGGTYEFSGSLEQGQIVVDATDENVTLSLNSFDITNSTDAPVLVLNAKNVYLNLADGTENSVVDARSEKEDEAESEEDHTAAIYSKDDLIITGSGSLNVNGGYKDGITSKDDLEVESGAITVDAADDGIVGKDSVIIKAADITITAGDDGVKSTNDEDDDKGYIQIDGNSIKITSEGKGIDAVKTVTINGGTIDIKAGNEGIEGLDVVINDGDINIDAADDGINISDGSGGDMNFGGQPPEMPADGEMKNERMQNGGMQNGGMKFGGMMDQAIDGTLTINGGNITILAEGDGLDSNGSIVVNGGYTVVFGTTGGGNGGLDYNGTCDVNDGILIVTSSGDMEQDISLSSKATMIKQSFDETVAAGSTIQVTDESGNTLYELVLQKDCRYFAVSSTEVTGGCTISVKG